jgi:hypothetical protein
MHGKSPARSTDNLDGRRSYAAVFGRVSDQLPVEVGVAGDPRENVVPESLGISGNPGVETLGASPVDPVEETAETRDVPCPNREPGYVAEVDAPAESRSVVVDDSAVYPEP